MGARRRRLNKQLVYGERTVDQLDPFQPEIKEPAKIYRDTHASTSSFRGLLVSVIAFLVMAGWAILMVVHKKLFN